MEITEVNKKRNEISWGDKKKKHVEFLWSFGVWPWEFQWV